MRGNLLRCHCSVLAAIAATRKPHKEAHPHVKNTLIVALSVSIVETVTFKNCVVMKGFYFLKFYDYCDRCPWSCILPDSLSSLFLQRVEIQQKFFWKRILQAWYLLLIWGVKERREACVKLSVILKELMWCSDFTSVIGSVGTVCSLEYFAIWAAKVSVPWQHRRTNCVQGGGINTFRKRG